jgi:TolB-like protein/Tfp pilus assembly protein PilF
MNVTRQLYHFSEPNVTDIFLSYNREDQIVAKRFAQGFDSQGYKVWWDTTLRAGEAYDEVTEAALRSAKAVVVLWSQKSVKSRWVRAEALLAHRNKTLVPCMIEPCERPIMFELTQTAEIYGWKGNRSDPRWIDLLADVKSLIAKNHSALEDPTPITALLSAAPKPITNRRTLIVSAAAFALVGGGVGIWVLRDRWQGPASASANANSVAVLPFINISGDATQSYFADGLSAEVRAELASNIALRVAAQTSSEVFKTRSSNAQTMARQLGVAFLLDGNVRKAASTARINAELIDGKTGFSLWAKTFDRPLDDIFAVQSEIAQAVVTALLAKLPQPEDAPKGAVSASKMARGGTRDLAAYEEFLHGRALFESALSAQTDRDALAAFDRALALDQNYAAAFAGRARALSVIASQSGEAALLIERQRAAIAAANKAVELAPTFADGYSALGFILFTNKLDARAAKPAFDKSLQYGSGNGDVLTGFAMFCGRTGRKQEAASTIQQALSRDPLNPTVYRCAGQIAAMARQYDPALTYYDRALAKNPKASVVQALIGASLFWKGQLKQARAAYALEPNKVFGLPGLAIIDMKEGRKSAAQAALAQLAADFSDSALFQQAQVYAAWGDKDRALSTLERAYITGDSGLASLLTDPFFDPIRNEPRFLQLLKSIGFV